MNFSFYCEVVSNSIHNFSFLLVNGTRHIFNKIQILEKFAILEKILEKWHREINQKQKREKRIPAKTEETTSSTSLNFLYFFRKFQPMLT